MNTKLKVAATRKKPESINIEICKENFDTFCIAADLYRQDFIKNLDMSEKDHKKGKVTPEIAVRLSMVLGSSPESWMGHQTAYDLWQVEQHKNELQISPLLAKTA